MFVHYRTRGFILKKEERGEADLLFTVYTKDFGKIEVLGKAIRKTSSKLRPGAEIFCLSEIEFVQGKAYKTLTDAFLIKKFTNIGTDLKKLRIAYKISGILDDLVKEQESDNRGWWLLKEVFEKLDNWKNEGSLEIIHHYFFWNLVSLLGYQPELKSASVCGKKIEADLAKILKIIIKKNWQVLTRIKITSLHLRLLKNISQWYNKEVCAID